MSKAIQTGILAYGRSGRLFHAPFVTSNPNFNLRAVTERTNKEVHKHFPGVISYNSVEELIADREIELVVINTPNNTHFEFAKKAILAGKHVLIEKPMVPTKEEAAYLFDLGRSHQKQVMVYQNRRWDSDFKMLKEIIEGGRLGKVIEAHFRFDRYRAEIGLKSFKEKPFPASGIAYDLGSHLVDQVICLFGEPMKSIKIGTKNRENTEVEDYVNFILSYSEGAQVSVTTSYLVTDPGPGYVLHGTKGSFKMDRTDVQEEQLMKGVLPTDPEYGKESESAKGKLTFFNEDGEKVTELIEPSRGNYSGLFDAVYQHIREGVPFPVKEKEILDQLEILEQPFWNQDF
jgi:predicted dehydrogenase